MAHNSERAERAAHRDRLVIFIGIEPERVGSNTGRALSRARPVPSSRVSVCQRARRICLRRVITGRTRSQSHDTRHSLTVLAHKSPACNGVLADPRTPSGRPRMAHCGPKPVGRRHLYALSDPLMRDLRRAANACRCGSIRRGDAAHDVAPLESSVCRSSRWCCYRGRAFAPGLPTRTLRPRLLVVALCRAVRRVHDVDRRRWFRVGAPCGRARG